MTPHGTLVPADAKSCPVCDDDVAILHLVQLLEDWIVLVLPFKPVLCLGHA